jgi:hypothetical protein
VKTLGYERWGLEARFDTALLNFVPIQLCKKLEILMMCSFRFNHVTNHKEPIQKY